MQFFFSPYAQATKMLGGIQIGRCQGRGYDCQIVTYVSIRVGTGDISRKSFQ